MIIPHDLPNLISGEKYSIGGMKGDNLEGGSPSRRTTGKDEARPRGQSPSWPFAQVLLDGLQGGGKLTDMFFVLFCCLFRFLFLSSITTFCNSDNGKTVFL